MFLTIEDQKIYYQLQQIQEKAPKLLFIPGTASDLRQEPQIFNSSIAKQFEILSYDQRGIGQSNSPKPDPTMRTYARDVKHVLDHVGWKRCYVVGESFGGMVAQEFAIHYPEY